ncbi:hypothetical protein [Bradyrhizobium sp. BR 1432]|uniref:hypothetical protein n=1 Tax=Bradyrhizobium sp. BR 1432 TaxID=3447966 RepID=UPI003EE78287
MIDLDHDVLWLEDNALSASEYVCRNGGQFPGNCDDGIIRNGVSVVPDLNNGHWATLAQI